MYAEIFIVTSTKALSYSTMLGIFHDKFMRNIYVVILIAHHCHVYALLKIEYYLEAFSHI